MHTLRGSVLARASLTLLLLDDMFKNFLKAPLFPQKLFYFTWHKIDRINFFPSRNTTASGIYM
jgi:hypothetical protein